MSYECRTCKKEFVLLTKDVKEQLERNRYLVCPYCSSHRVSKENISHSLKGV